MELTISRCSIDREERQTAGKMLTAMGCCRLGWRMLLPPIHLPYCKSTLGTLLWLKKVF